MLGAPYKNQVRATGLVFANYHTAYDIGRWPNAMVTYPEVGRAGSTSPAPGTTCMAFGCGFCIGGELLNRGRDHLIVLLAKDSTKLWGAEEASEQYCLLTDPEFSREQRRWQCVTEGKLKS